MKIIIKNPAPTDSRQKKWGDYHFGRSLSKYLNRLGAKTENHYKPEWDKKNRADAVIVLRGKYPYHPKPGSLNILWVISHPGAVGVDECNAYDAVCVASHKHYELLKQNLRIPVFPLLQCTDTEEFRCWNSVEDRRDIIFVGNTRGVPRGCVIWAIEYGLPLKIWGRGWKEWVPSKYIIADYISNEELGKLYSKARFTLNDHWNDMRALGYINNRIFDSIACGLPIISDFHQELSQLITKEILYYSTKEEFFNCLDRIFLEYPIYLQNIATLNKKIEEEFSFESRAKFLYGLIHDLKKKAAAESHSLQGGGKKYRALASSKPYFKPQGYLEDIKKNFSLNQKTKLCPICGAKPETFLPFGITKRSNAQCPSCNSLERHRLFYVYFANRLYPCLDAGTKHFLHIAPERHLTKFLQEFPDINYLSGDLDSDFTMVRLDITNSLFSDSRFDVIICFHVLEHIQDDKKAMQEMHRLLKPKGFAIIQVPVYGKETYENSSIISPKDREKHFGQSDHVRKYGLDITEKLKQAHFKVSVVKLFDELGSDLAEFLGIKKGQIIFECQKE